MKTALCTAVCFLILSAVVVHAVDFNQAVTIRFVDKDGKGIPRVKMGLVLTSPADRYMVMIRNGDFFATDFTSESDGEGCILIPAQKEKYDIFALHEKGYIQLSSDALKQQGTIQLKGWSKIKGVVLNGSKPVGDITVGYQSMGEIPENPYESIRIPIFTISSETTTNNQGEFEMNVLPGKCFLAKSARTNKQEACSAFLNMFEVSPGQTLQVTLGGKGRPVAGKFLIPTKDWEGLDWLGNATLTSSNPNVNRFSKEVQTALRGKTREEKRLWLDQWFKTPEGKKSWDETREKWNDRKLAGLFIQKDGSFYIEDVEPGKYYVRASFTIPPVKDSHQKYIGRVKNYEITIPDDKEKNLDKQLVLDPIPVKLLAHVKEGDLAPDFSFTPANGKTKKLSDYKGKYVVMIFGTGFTLEERLWPSLKEAYAKYGMRPDFAILEFDPFVEREDWEADLKLNKLPWEQSYLGKDETIPDLYGSNDYLSVWLIGPDQKVLAAELREGALLEILAKNIP